MLDEVTGAEGAGERGAAESGSGPWPVLLGLALLVACLPFATVHFLPRWLLTGALGAACLTLAVRPDPRLGSPARAGAAFLTAAATLQLLGLGLLLPVGPELRAALQPGLASLVEGSLALAGADSHWLAVDPPRALRAWAAGGAFLGLCGLAAAALRTPRDARLLLGTVVAVAVLVLGIGLLHRATDAGAIWWASGVPAWSRVAFFAPFVNPNHAGLLFAAALPLALALALFDRPVGARDLGLGQVLGLLAAALLLVGIQASRSRGAVLEGAVALAVLAAIQGTRAVRLGAAFVVAAGVAAVAWVGLPEAVQALGDLLVPEEYRPDPLGQRPSLWQDGLGLVHAAPWVGVGPGGFEDAFSVVKTLPIYGQAQHAHLDLLEALVERGLVLGGAWILLLAAPLLLGLRRALQSPPGDARTALAATVAAGSALAVASLYDFPLRTGAHAVLAAILGGLCLGLAGPLRRPDRAEARLPLGLLGLASLLSSVLALGLAGPWSPAEGELERAAELRSSARAPGGEADAAALLEESTALARGALGRTPLDHAPLLQLAEARYAAGDVAGAEAALLHTTQVYPTLPGAWLALARLRQQEGRVLEAQEAWLGLLSLDLPDNDDAEPFIRAALATGEDPGTTALAVIPDRADRLRVAGSILAGLGDTMVAELLLLRAVELDPESRLVYARQLVRWGRQAEALPLTEGFREDHCLAQRVRSEALLALDDPEGAVAAGRAALAGCPERVQAAARLDLARALLAAEDLAAQPHVEAALADRPERHGLRRQLIALLHAGSRHRDTVPHYDALEELGVLSPAEAAARERAALGMAPSRFAEEAPAGPASSDGEGEGKGEADGAPRGDPG